MNSTWIGHHRPRSTFVAIGVQQLQRLAIQTLTSIEMIIGHYSYTTDSYNSRNKTEYTTTFSANK